MPIFLSLKLAGLLFAQRQEAGLRRWHHKCHNHLTGPEKGLRQKNQLCISQYRDRSVQKTKMRDSESEKADYPTDAVICCVDLFPMQNVFFIDSQHVY